MQIGMIGLGRMGASMVTRLLRGGHDRVVHDQAPEGIARAVARGATGAASLQQVVDKLKAPRAVWLMVPAAALAASNIAHVGVGTSGGVVGLDRGYCLMIGGSKESVQYLAPAFVTLAPGAGTVVPTPGRHAGDGTADQGWLHCGPHGAGHFVKMVHNGIEYGVMAAYAEGLNILHHANVGLSAALYARFGSRGEADLANRVQSAMRHEFGGHVEKPVDAPTTGT